MLKNFGKGEQPVEVPPNANSRTFNENDILGDFDRDDKGNIVVLTDDEGRNHDKLGNMTNERGYLTNPDTGDIIENYSKQTITSPKQPTFCVNSSGSPNTSKLCITTNSKQLLN